MVKCIKLIVDGLTVQVALIESDVIDFFEYGFEDFETDVVETEYTICGGYYLDYCISSQLSWFDMFEYFNAYLNDKYKCEGFGELNTFATLTSSQLCILVNNVNVMFDFSGDELVKIRDIKFDNLDDSEIEE
jgi:hypothetical protein